MAQTKEDLEEFYKELDPWGYTATMDDLHRRRFIANLCRLFTAWSGRILDLGAGEGWITRYIEGNPIEFIELSDTAASRMPKTSFSNHPITRIAKPKGTYELVLALGVLYEQYDYMQMREWIENHCKTKLLTCHYDKAGKAHDKFDKKQMFYGEFPYREGKQILRIYDWEE